MNRILRILLLASALTALLCVSAFAVDDATIENVTVNETFQACVTMEVQDAEKLLVTYNNAKDGAQYLILVTNTDITDASDITDATVEYIDQAEAAGNSVSFTVNQRKLSGNKTYSVYLSSGAQIEEPTAVDITSRKLVGTYTYHASYILGDITGDGLVTVSDITVLIDHLLDREIDTENNTIEAGNVNQDETINLDDLVLIIDRVLDRVDEDFNPKTY